MLAFSFLGVLLLSYGSNGLQLGFLNPLGLGSHGSSYPYGQGAVNRGQQGFNPLGLVDSLLKNIPGSGGNLGLDIPNILNPVPGIPPIPTFGDLSSVWKHIPPIPTGPFGGSFIPPIFGGGMQPTGTGFGNRGPQMIPIGNPEVSVNVGGGGNQGPTYPQQPYPMPGTGSQEPPVQQGPNLPPVSPGGNIPGRPAVPDHTGPGPNVPPPAVPPGGNVPGRPVVPTGGRPDSADRSEELCESRDGENAECRPATQCRHSQRLPGLCTVDRGLVCCSRNTETPPTQVPVGNPENRVTVDSLQEENWQLCGKHAPAISFAVNYVAAGRANGHLGKFPFTVAVFRDNFHPFNFWCGGALITRRAVLSAAHCFHGASESTPFLLRVGSLDTAEDDDSSHIIERKVQSIYIHPDYNDGQFRADLALLILDRPINVSPTGAQIPCLPETGSSPDSSTVTILGWTDEISEGKVLTRLHEAEVDVVSNRNCNTAYQLLPTYQTEFPKGIDEKFICTNNQTAGNAVACNDDSGGLLLQKLDFGKRVVFEIIGIVSSGVECSMSDYPGVYTKVASFVPWILQTLLNISQDNVEGIPTLEVRNQ